MTIPPTPPADDADGSCAHDAIVAYPTMRVCMDCGDELKPTPTPPADADMALELALAATKVLSEHYAALRAAAEKAADKLDATLLHDPFPLADYAASRDILRLALHATGASA